MATQFLHPAAENQTTMILKKTKGRRKIEIKPILDKKNLQVTFSKRRGGVFKKASELSILTGADIAIIVRSPANKFYTFGNPNVDSVLHQYETGAASQVKESCLSSRNKYMEAFKRLENEKKKKTSTDLQNNWWDMEFEGMELRDLEEYLSAIEGLKSKVLERADEMNKVCLDLQFEDDHKSFLCENPFINARRVHTLEDISTEDINAACSSSWNLLPTGVQCYVDNGNGSLEDIFNNV